MSKMHIQVFISEDYTNLGTVIRDLDTKGIIKSDFVLINGDCVGNLQLDDLIRTHKYLSLILIVVSKFNLFYFERQNVKQDPGCVMTSVFRKVSPQHRIRSYENEAVVILDTKQKIVHLEHNLRKTIHVPLVISFDLISNGIFIFSPPAESIRTKSFDSLRSNRYRYLDLFGQSATGF